MSGDYIPSIFLKPVENYKVFDPRIKLAPEPSYHIEKGGQDIVYYQETSQNFTNNYVNFTVSVPNERTIVDRNFKVKMVFRATIRSPNNADQGGPITQMGTPNPGEYVTNNEGFNALRADPIASVTKTARLLINNAEMSFIVDDSIAALKRYKTSQNDTFRYMSMSPCYPDQSLEYSDLIGTNLNPLAGTISASPYNEPRGAFPMKYIGVAPGAANRNEGEVWEYELTENVYVPPALFGDAEDSGLAGITKLSLYFNFSDLSRMWCHASTGYNIETPEIKLESAEFLVTFINPQVTEILPERMYYPLFESIDRSTSHPAIAPGFNNQQTITNNNIQLQQIPNRIYIFAARQDSDKTHLTTDTFGSIITLNAKFNGQAGLLSGIKQEQLYQLCVKNGLNMSWRQFSRDVGSVVCIIPSEDFGLNANQSNGLEGQYNLQVQATIVNYSSAPITYDLHVVCIMEGILEVSKGTAVKRMGVVKEANILDPSIPVIDKKVISTFYGGNFWSSMKKFGRNLQKGYKQVAPHMKDIIKYGREGAKLYKDIKTGKGVGGRFVGGAALSRRDMAEILAEY